MKTISGFWAGTYTYPKDALPPVNFDCELTQNGSRIIGEITESHRPGQMLAAGLSGSLRGHTIEFIKSYRQAGPAFLADITYSGQVSPKKNHIAGVWKVGGRKGSFEMHRDAGEIRKALTRETADELKR